MKISTLVSLSVFASFIGASIGASVASAADVVTTCAFTIKIPENTKVVPTTYQIIKDGEKLTAITTQIVDGTSLKLPEESVEVADYAVRSDLKSETENMNPAERLIAGTMEFLANPDIGSSFSVGLDLKAVRHAKVFQIGQFTNMGGSAIIEAQDADGKALGSFVTGFMPFACNQ